MSALWKNGTAKITPNHGKSLTAEVKCRIGMQATLSLMKCDVLINLIKNLSVIEH